MIVLMFLAVVCNKITIRKIFLKIFLSKLQNPFYQINIQAGANIVGGTQQQSKTTFLLDKNKCRLVLVQLKHFSNPNGGARVCSKLLKIAGCKSIYWSIKLSYIKNPGIPLLVTTTA